MGALSVLATLWRWRLPLAILAGLAVAGAAKLYIDHLQSALATAEAAVTAAEDANATLNLAVQTIQAEKEASERILGNQIQRRAAEADRLGALVKRVLAYDAKAECPVAPSLDAALDGLPIQLGEPAQ